MGKARLTKVANLRSPDPLEILNKLELGTGKAARLCGVTRRQLGYWLAQGALGQAAPKNREHVRFGWGSLARILALKQIRGQGRGVRRAKLLLQRFAERESLPSRACSQTDRVEFLARQAERLERASASVRALAVKCRRAGEAVRRSVTGVPVACVGLDDSGREERMCCLAEWLVSSGQYWTRDVVNGQSLLSDLELCRRIGLFTELLEANLSTVAPPHVTDCGAQNGKEPHRN